MSVVGNSIRQRARAPSDRPARVADSPSKRGLDLTISALALLLFLPLCLVVAIAIRIETGGPVIFRQRRTGLHGRPFSIYKFRTMSVGEDGPLVRQAQACDQRVTRIGRILRKFSIDELPQLLNVLRGEMSIVGPRPHALAHDIQWAEAAPGYADRFLARPGLTGLAQIRGHRGIILSPECLINRVQADRSYIENWSLRTDLEIIVKTVPLLFGDPRAF